MSDDEIEYPLRIGTFKIVTAVEPGADLKFISFPF